MTRLLAVNGSYRENGAIDQALAVATEAASAAGASIDVVNLRDFPIAFCRNCRHCTQVPGDAPGDCVHQDGMRALIDKIEAADGLILASPTNFSSVTAVFKRFMERLVPYAYWPWGQPWPRYRKQGQAAKKALLISSSAAPGWLGRWSFGSGRQLRMTAKIIGAKPVGLVFTGLVSRQQKSRLPSHARRDAERLARRLLD